MKRAPGQWPVLTRPSRGLTDCASFTVADIRPIAFLAHLSQHVIGCGSGQRLIGVEYPNALLLSEQAGSADGSRRYLVAAAFRFKRVARLQMAAHYGRIPYPGQGNSKTRRFLVLLA